MSETNPAASTSVTDGDWVVDSSGVMGSSEDAIREALAPTKEMPALEVDPDTGDEVSGPGSPSWKARQPTVADANQDAFARPATPATPVQESAATSEDDDETPPAAESKPEPKKPSKAARHQQRIAEINARIAERVRARAEAERQPAPAAPVAPATPPAERREQHRTVDLETGAGSGNEDLLADRPEWSDFDAQGKDYKEFEKADRAWLAKTLRTIEERAVAVALSQAQGNDTRTLEAIQHKERVQQAKAKYPDFAQTVAQTKGIERTPFLEHLITRNTFGMDVLYHLGQHTEDAALLAALTHEENDPNRVLPHLFHTLQDSGTNPVPVLSYLTAHPEEAQALLDLPPQRALIKIGQILAGADAKTSGPSAKPAPKLTPFTPVDGGSSMRADAADDPEPADDASDDAWFSWSQRQKARERRAARGE